MNIQPNSIHRFFTETIPQAGKALKAGFLDAIKALSPTERKISAAISHKEDWSNPVMAAKYSAAVKLLAARVRLLGANTGEERARLGLSTNEVALLLCCFCHYIQFKKDSHPSVQTLFALLQDEKLFFSDDKQLFSYDMSMWKIASQYIEGLNKDSQDPRQSALREHLLEFLDPVLLIPKSHSLPVQMHKSKEDTRLYSMEYALQRVPDDAEGRAKHLAELLSWLNQPERVALLKKTILELPDFTLLQRENISLDKAGIQNCVYLSTWLKNKYGSEVLAQNPIAAPFVQYTENYLVNIRPSLLDAIDLEACRQAFASWDTRETWTQDEAKTRYKALVALQNWNASSNQTIFPDRIVREYPKITEIQRYIRENKENLAKAKNLGYPQDISIPILSRKIAALSENKTEKENRLTIKEFYFLKDIFSSDVPSWLTEETYKKWKTFIQEHLTLPTDAILVNFVKLPKNTNAPPIYRIAEKIIGVHANLAMRDSDRKLQVVGLGAKGVYRKPVGDLLKPTVDSYELDLDRLARGVPEGKRDEFKNKFPGILEQVTKKTLELSYPNSQQQKVRFKALFRIAPRLIPSQAGFTNEKTSICTEFVLRSIIEATVRTFEAIGELPPDTATYFGLKSRQNLLLMAPAALERRFKRAGILKPLNSIERIIRFS